MRGCLRDSTFAIGKLHSVHESVGELSMSNIAGKAYAMNVLTPMRPWRTWIQNTIFMLARAMPSQLSGLLGLRLIHFARWVIIRRNQWPDLTNGKQKLENDY